MGSFRLAAGRGHLHPQCNFAESLVETVRMLLCHSCRSELHVVPRFPVAQTIPSPVRSELRISLPEYFRLPCGEEQGRRVMRSCERIQGSHPLSRYGDRASCARSYPRYYPWRPCRRQEGFTDLSRSYRRNRFHLGQFYLPDKEFRSTLLPLRVSAKRAGHFCRPPRVATRDGLYLHPERGCPACSL